MGPPARSRKAPEAPRVAPTSGPQASVVVEVSRLDDLVIKTPKMVFTNFRLTPVAGVPAGNGMGLTRLAFTYRNRTGKPASFYLTAVGLGHDGDVLWVGNALGVVPNDAAGVLPREVMIAHPAGYLKQTASVRFRAVTSRVDGPLPTTPPADAAAPAPNTYPAAFPPPALNPLYVPVSPAANAPPAAAAPAVMPPASVSSAPAANGPQPCFPCRG